MTDSYAHTFTHTPTYIHTQTHTHKHTQTKYLNDNKSVVNADAQKEKREDGIDGTILHSKDGRHSVTTAGKCRWAKHIIQYSPEINKRYENYDN